MVFPNKWEHHFLCRKPVLYCGGVKMQKIYPIHNYFKSSHFTCTNGIKEYFCKNIIMAQWFENWFDSPFYHKLYFDRDEEEASLFIGNLMRYLQPPANSFMLDVACGKGRHSRTMADYGNTVTGIDISPQSIAFAKQFEDDYLEFFEHDMRLTFRINYYHYAFNLFTSFGYFNSQREHDDALRTIAQSLKPNGYLIFDYLNSFYVEQHLIPSQKKEIDGTVFNVRKWKTNLHFVKQIQIEDNSLTTPLLFQEQVAAFTLVDFEKMLQKQDLTITATFGDYELNPFEQNNAKRLIIIAQKKV
jgi:SAM-dependent methyltransferase